MNEVVLVALISAGIALVTALLTQILAARAASKSADRADKREALQWQRNEAIRLQELERKDAQAALEWERSEAQKKQELRDARLQVLWDHVLTARRLMQDALEAAPVVGEPRKEAVAIPAASLPATAAAQAYSVALLGLASVRPSAKTFYEATARLQLALLACDEELMHSASKRWNEAFNNLERQIGAVADGLLDESPESQHICIQ